jgi:hypothetical protein
MGNTGVNHANPEKGDYHVHYQLKDRAGKSVNPTEFWDQKDPIDPNPSTPPYLSESQRAAEIMSGGNAGAAPPDRLVDRYYSPFSRPFPGSAGASPPGISASPTPFDNRFTKWGSVPASAAPPAASDRPESFDNRNGCPRRHGTGRALATIEQAAWHLQRQADADLSGSAADLWSAGSITRQRRQ